MKQCTPANKQDPPLVFDLDGTLLATDAFVEQFFVKWHSLPYRLIGMLLLSTWRPAALKSSLATDVSLCWSAMPWRPAVVHLLENARTNARMTVLATAADRVVARQAAEYLGGFDEVFASDGITNLKGGAKSKALVERFGARGFDYVGDSMADLPVWACARVGWVARSSPRLRRRLSAAGIPIQELSEAPAQRGALFAALRPLHWLKNAALILPLAAAHQLAHIAVWPYLLLAMISFSAAASAVYLFNDLTDVQDDRKHPVKRFRPLANGGLWIWNAISACALLSGLALLACIPCGPQALLLLLAYALLAAAYCLLLKSRTWIDIACLLGFYMIRIAVGASVAGISISTWFLAACVTGFLSLSLGKRHSELLVRSGSNDPHSKRRGYAAGDLPLLRLLGQISGYLSCCVVAAYSFSSNSSILYRHPWAFLVAAVLLAVANWRFWDRQAPLLLCDDPLRGVLRDPILLILAVVSIVIAVLAT